jgi:hypothetical protein
VTAHPPTSPLLQVMALCPVTECVYMSIIMGRFLLVI